MAVLGDNYSYLVIDSVTNTAVAIDPCDPTPVMVRMHAFLSVVSVLECVPPFMSLPCNLYLQTIFIINDLEFVLTRSQW